MLKEFREFAMRGNVVDLAIGVIIGAAFGAIVQSMVADIIMPLVGAVTGGLDFSNYFVALSSKVTADSLTEAKKQGAEPAEAARGGRARHRAGTEPPGSSADGNPRRHQAAKRLIYPIDKFDV
jgi:hypothetical protein